MTGTISIPDDCILPDSTAIEAGVSIGRRVVMAGEGIAIRTNARLDAACVIGEGVTIGQGAWGRAGSVVLRSVPPNAIVEGNPAQVVGNLNNAESDRRPDPRHIDIHGFAHLERPARVPLGVGQSALFLMRRITDARGALTVGEVPTEVPFSPGLQRHSGPHRRPKFDHQSTDAESSNRQQAEVEQVRRCGCRRVEEASDR